ncbi:peptidoglycan-binding protein [Microcoleus sp. Pol11C1]|uniref:peptidoglycan-binding protein n=1 Tax=unclassified Microcoleus TaxID=2642155 RepID=UPI002FD2B302
MTDSSHLLFNQPVIVEACEEFVQRDRLEVRGSFPGLLKDAPMSSTVVVNGLSQQLISQLQLIVPDTFVSFDDLNVDLLDAAFPYVQCPAKQALQKAIQDRGQTMQVNSAYRTIAQQMLLYNDRFNNSNPVAAPGASNHQTGLAIDIEDATGWEVYLMRYGWNPLPGDPPHFDYQGDGTIDLRSQSILAFQQLWNQNNPHAKISEDGDFGTQTEDALNRSPASGFSKAPWDDKPRTLRLAVPRMEGSDVLLLQESLKKAGIVVGADGEFGPGTDKAVKEFQQKKGLKPDGIVGLKTREQMA